MAKARTQTGGRPVPVTRRGDRSGIIHVKTYKHLWEQLISEENFQRAERESIRGKSGQRGVRVYMRDPDGKRERLRQNVIAGQYRTGKYIAKRIHEPKERIIYKLPFYPDRLMHHAVMNILRPIMEEKFIQNSYACQTNKGPLAAALKCSEDVRKNRFCLQCDIRKFYPSINQKILSSQMHRIIWFFLTSPPPPFHRICAQCDSSGSWR